LGEGGYTADISDILTDSSIEVNCVPIIYEDVTVDFVFDFITAVPSIECMVFFVVTPCILKTAQGFEVSIFS
jgi:hypothetical protein